MSFQIQRRTFRRSSATCEAALKKAASLFVIRLNISARLLKCQKCAETSPASPNHPRSPEQGEWRERRRPGHSAAPPSGRPQVYPSLLSKLESIGLADFVAKQALCLHLHYSVQSTSKRLCPRSPDQVSEPTSPLHHHLSRHLSTLNQKRETLKGWRHFINDEQPVLRSSV
jgi:hypothetical protein